MSLADARLQTLALQGEDLFFAYGGKKILDGIDFAIQPGELVVLLGPSGCGKTTLFNVVAGLLAPSAGVVRIDGAVVADGLKKVFAPPERRGLGMVFQDYALWPHMTIAGNVGFPLEMRGVARAERAERVRKALARVGLADFERRAPAHLSGGQQQRAALARAIVAEPALVLFDEPLSNLDRELRESLAQELSALMKNLSLTGLYVTHDQAEAFAIADRIIVMRGGRIVQNASPEDLVRAPADPEIAAFLDLGAIVCADLRDGGWFLRGAEFRLEPSHNVNGARSAHILVPRSAARLTNPEGAHLFGEVIRCVFHPEGYSGMVRLHEDGPELAVASPLEQRLRVGDRIGVALDASQLRWFPDADD